jgi:hypothetical protein
VERDLTNNVVEVELAIMPPSTIVRDLHVTPHPVSYAAGEPRFRFEILHPEGDFNAVMDVWIYDILGALAGRGTLEKTPTTQDFEPGENSIELARFVSGRLVPGLYVCKTRLRLLGEPGVFETTFKFAVDR